MVVTEEGAERDNANCSKKSGNIKTSGDATGKWFGFPAIVGKLIAFFVNIVEVDAVDPASKNIDRMIKCVFEGADGVPDAEMKVMFLAKAIGYIEDGDSAGQNNFDGEIGIGCGRRRAPDSNEKDDGDDALGENADFHETPPFLNRRI